MTSEIEKPSETADTGKTKSGDKKPGAFFDKLDSWAGNADDFEDPGRWPLMRDLAVFQGKLALDALRDLALSPISIIAAGLGFVRDKDRPGRYFYPLMKTGRRSDTVINLFGASHHAGLDGGEHDDPSVDDLIARFETIIVKEYESGGMTAHAKNAIDKAFDKAHEATRNEVEKAGAQIRKEAETVGAHIRKEADKFKAASDMTDSKSEAPRTDPSKDSTF